MRIPQIQTEMRALTSSLSIEQSATMLNDMILRHGQEEMTVIRAFDTLFEHVSIPLRFRAQGPLKDLIREAAVNFNNTAQLLVPFSHVPMLTRVATGIVALANAVDTTPNYIHFRANAEGILSNCLWFVQFGQTERSLLEKLMEACFTFWLCIDQMQANQQNKTACIETLKFGVENLASTHPAVAQWFNLLMLEGFNESIMSQIDSDGLQIIMN